MTAPEAFPLAEIGEFPSIRYAEEPYGLYDALRHEEPVFNVPGTNTYVVSRWEDIRFIGGHNDLFSVDTRRDTQPFDPLGQDQRTRALSVFELDPPAHRPRRETLFRSFTPGRLKEYEAHVRRVVIDLIEGFLPDGRVEFVAQFATLVPVHVMRELQGFGEEDLDWLLEWGLVETSGLVYQPPEEQERMRRAAMFAREKMAAAIRARAEEPRDDLLSELIHRAIARDGEFDFAKALADCSAIFRGGIITTAHAMASAMLLLIQHPQQLAKVQADPRKIPRMFEEAIRLESPVQWNPRKALRDVEVGGVTIPAGALVVIVYASGNRDTRQFDDPEAFDIERRNVNDHVTFGYGPHFCLGAPLARLEGRVAFEELLARATNFRLAPGNDLAHQKSAFFRALVELNLEFDPASAIGSGANAA